MTDELVKKLLPTEIAVSKAVKKTVLLKQNHTCIRKPYSKTKIQGLEKYTCILWKNHKQPILMTDYIIIKKDPNLTSIKSDNLIALCKQCFRVLKNRISKKLVIPTGRTKPIIANIWGNYEDTETKITFDAHTKEAIGVQEKNGTVSALDDRHVAICVSNGWNYVLPYSSSDFESSIGFESSGDFNQSGDKSNWILANLSGWTSENNNITKSTDDHHTIPRLSLPQSNNKECCICFENIADKYALVPCGHTSTCGICVQKIEKCPICVTSVTNSIRIYD